MTYLAIETDELSSRGGEAVSCATLGCASNLLILGSFGSMALSKVYHAPAALVTPRPAYANVFLLNGCQVSGYHIQTSISNTDADTDTNETLSPTVCPARGSIDNAKRRWSRN